MWLFVQIIEAMIRCQSALVWSRKSSQDKILKLSFRDKPRREKGHWGAGRGRERAWVQGFHQPNVLMPISLISAHQGWVAAASSLCSWHGQWVKRTTDDLNHVFLSQQTPKEQEIGPSHQRACKCVHILCLFLWGARMFLAVLIHGKFRCRLRGKVRLLLSH